MPGNLYNTIHELNIRKEMSATSDASVFIFYIFVENKILIRKIK